VRVPGAGALDDLQPARTPPAALSRSIASREVFECGRRPYPLTAAARVKLKPPIVDGAQEIGGEPTIERRFADPQVAARFGK
jgi:hypothetical protein